MKKLVILMLTVVMLFSLCTTALAASATYSSTRSFVSELDKENKIYTVLGISEQGNELIEYKTTLDNGQEITVVIAFDDSMENCAMYIWNLITFKDQDFSKVLRTVNSINAEYRFASFYVDESDNTVTVQADAIFRVYDVGEICHELLSRMINIVNDEYGALAVYDQ